ncbi:MAG TPA: GntR family transcriptional regulator [Candidatus Baltobacteraceae bacterium]
MATIFTVDPRSGVPIYLQLIEQVKRGVALGTLASGEQLPTVKALALELTVNPNTVARAYRDLERDGVIETSPGRGSFVRNNGPASSEIRTDVAEPAVDNAIRTAKGLGLDSNEVRRLFERALSRWYPGEER